MKTKLVYVLMLATIIITTAHAENTYVSVMKKNLSMLDTISRQMDVNGFVSLANKFDLIAKKEQSEWLPMYYAAYCYCIANYGLNSKKQKDSFVDKAEQYIDQAAERAGEENDEIVLLKAYIIQARSNVDPKSRARKYSGQVENLLKKVEKLNGENPRIYFMRGENLYYTPKMFGGGKDKAKPVLEMAIEKYSTFVLKDELYPSWGKERTMTLLSDCN
ncbi:MAG: hypothetical protein MI922_16310 [Bacteroidales bacterium]|nr:hypothetical protein [Bacteroidales bacterium]